MLKLLVTIVQNNLNCSYVYQTVSFGVIFKTWVSEPATWARSYYGSCSIHCMRLKGSIAPVPQRYLVMFKIKNEQIFLIGKLYLLDITTVCIALRMCFIIIE
jgi:hypothetical protein